MKIDNKTLLPDHYIEIGEPSYQGRGNHSVLELESICQNYKDLVHQLRVKQQRICEIAKIEILNDCFVPQPKHEVCSDCGNPYHERDYEHGMCHKCWNEVR